MVSVPGFSYFMVTAILMALPLLLCLLVPRHLHFVDGCCQNDYSPFIPRSVNRAVLQAASDGYCHKCSPGPEPSRTPEAHRRWIIRQLWDVGALTHEICRA